jgi:hypothetical protein
MANSYYDPERETIAKFMKKIFVGKYNSANETLRWTIECADGKHSIGLRLGSDIRMGKSIYIDGDYVTNIAYKGRKFFPEDTYDFDCYGEQVKIVFFGSKVYLVHRGIVHGTKDQYKPDRRFPLFIRSLLAVITLASVTLSLIIGGATGGLAVQLVVLVLASWIPITFAGMVFNAAGNPIYTTPRKLIIIFFLIIGSWGISWLIPLFAVNLIEFWKNE